MKKLLLLLFIIGLGFVSGCSSSGSSSTSSNTYSLALDTSSAAGTISWDESDSYSYVSINKNVFVGTWCVDFGSNTECADDSGSYTDTATISQDATSVDIQTILGEDFSSDNAYIISLYADASNYCILVYSADDNSSIVTCN